MDGSDINYHEVQVALAAQEARILALQIEVEAKLQSLARKEEKSQVLLPKLERPERFLGDRDKCSAFLAQCLIHFEVYDDIYYGFKNRLLFLASNLGGQAAKWMAVTMNSGEMAGMTWDAFTKIFTRAFGEWQEEVNAPGRLFAISHGKRTISEYAGEFQKLAILSKWDDKALGDAFYKGLNEELRNAIAVKGRPTVFAKLVERSLELGALLFVAQGGDQFKSSNFMHVSMPRNSGSGPMDVDAVQGNRFPQQGGRNNGFQSNNSARFQQQRVCFHCGRPGHIAKFCFARRKGQGVPNSGARIEAVEAKASRGEEISNIYTMLNQLSSKLNSLEMNKHSSECGGCVGEDGRMFVEVEIFKTKFKALLDTGATSSFISEDVAMQFKDKLEAQIPEILLKAIDGRGFERVSLKIGQAEVKLAGRVVKECLLVSQNIKHQVVLGISWFKRFKPRINWRVMEIAGLESQGNQQVEAICNEFGDLFLEATTESTLPPHRPFDCTIPVTTSTMPPPAATYQMAQDERKELREYLDKYLKLGWVYETDAPTASPILFVSKKDGGKRLCVDYRRLNSITESRCYPLPRIDDLLDRAASAKFFTALDLKDAYHLLRVS